MTSLCIKTGMASEYNIAMRFARPGTQVLTGLQTADSLHKLVPDTCKAIISFGLCGGLAPEAQIGQAFIYDRVVTPTTMYPANIAWRKRLFAATRYYERGCWSTGDFNTANDEQQRADLFNKSGGCWIIDDETYAVARFAAERGISWIGLRVVSDGAEDNLPPAVLNALNPDGTDNIWNVLESVVSDPAQIPALIKTATEANKSLAELRTAALQAGPDLQWVDP